MIALDPCLAEDGTNCFWDATQHGTGYGKSFFEYDGITVLIYVPKGYHVESVQVDPDHFFEPGYAGGLGYGVTFVQPDAPAPTATATATTQPSQAVPVSGSLPATGLDMTVPAILVAAAILVSFVGIGLAWKARAR